MGRAEAFQGSEVSFLLLYFDTFGHRSGRNKSCAGDEVYNGDHRF